MRKVQDIFRHSEYRQTWTLVLFGIPASIGGAVGFVFFGKIGAVVCAMAAYVGFAIIACNNTNFSNVWSGLTSNLTKVALVLSVVMVFVALAVAGLSALFGAPTSKVVNHSGQAHLAFAEIYA